MKSFKEWMKPENYERNSKICASFKLPSDQLFPNTRVKIKDLQKNTELNGLKGKIIRKIPSEGRYEIEVDGVKNLQKVKYDNVTPVEDYTHSKLQGYANRYFIRDYLSINKCAFPFRLILFSPNKQNTKTQKMFAYLIEQIGQDPFVRWLRGKNPGIFPVETNTSNRWIVRWLEGNYVSKIPNSGEYNPLISSEKGLTELKKYLQSCTMVPVSNRHSWVLF